MVLHVCTILKFCNVLLTYRLAQKHIAISTCVGIMIFQKRPAVSSSCLSFMGCSHSPPSCPCHRCHCHGPCCRHCRDRHRALVLAFPSPLLQPPLMSLQPSSTLPLLLLLQLLCPHCSHCCCRCPCPSAVAVIINNAIALIAAIALHHCLGCH